LHIPSFQRISHIAISDIPYIYDMKGHKGIRPHDIVVLLELLICDSTLTQSEIAQRLHLSQSEISESLRRSRLSGLLLPNERKVMKRSFRDFLIHGLRFVFPAMPGPIVLGVPTAHSAAPLSETFQNGTEKFVWPYRKGTVRGQAISPLYDSLPEAALSDSDLYKLCAITDALRLGDARVRKNAIDAFDTLV
jgi:predicted XRE-type DNA-binding protein